MNNKKILFLINKLGVGGAERVFIKTANRLCDEGFDVYFAFMYGDESHQTLLKDLKINNSNIFYAKFDKIFDFGAFLNFLKFVKKEKIDVCFATLDESNIIARLLKIFYSKMRIVIREANVAGPKLLWFKILDLFLNFLTNKIICVSEEVKNSLAKYQPMYKSKMVVLMNGVFVPNDFKNYDGLHLPVKIISVGSLTGKKGQKFLIEALSLVEKKHPNSFRLKIFGKGVLQNDLRSLIERLHLKEQIEICEPVSQEELSKKYLGADLFVLSSLWEGCPNVLLEAGACGLASISTKVSGANDILNNENGLLVEAGSSKALADALVFMVENLDKFSIFGKKARENVIENFSFDAYINKLKSILL